MANYVWKHKKTKVIRKLPITLAVTVLLGSALLPAGGVVAESLANSAQESSTEEGQVQEQVSQLEAEVEALESSSMVSEAVSSETSTAPSSTDVTMESSQIESEVTRSTSESFSELTTEKTSSFQESDDEVGRAWEYLEIAKDHYIANLPYKDLLIEFGRDWAYLDNAYQEALNLPLESTADEINLVVDKLNVLNAYLYYLTPEDLLITGGWYDYFRSWKPTYDDGSEYTDESLINFKQAFEDFWGQDMAWGIGTGSYHLGRHFLSYKNLFNSVNGLVLKDTNPTQKLDLTKLEAELKISIELLKGESLYVKNTWNNFISQYKLSCDDFEKAIAQNNSKFLVVGTIIQADIDTSAEALKTARLMLVKIKDDKPTPPITKPDGNGSNNAGNGSGSGNVTGNNNGSLSDNKDTNKVANISKTTNSSNKSKTYATDNGQLPQTGESNLMMASLMGLEVILACGLVYLVKKRKQMS